MASAPLVLTPFGSSTTHCQIGSSGLRGPPTNSSYKTPGIPPFAAKSLVLLSTTNRLFMNFGSRASIEPCVRSTAKNVSGSSLEIMLLSTGKCAGSPHE